MTSEIKNTSVVVVVVVLWILVVSGFNCLGSAELLPYSGSIFCPFRADSVDSDFFFFLKSEDEITLLPVLCHSETPNTFVIIIFIIVLLLVVIVSTAITW